MDEKNISTNEVELKNCAEDFVYFCENYVNILHPTKGLIKFKLFDFQKRFIKALEDHRMVIGKKFRQGGFTTTEMAWFLWRLLFKLDESNMVVCKSDREAIECNHIVRRMIAHLPNFLQPDLRKCNDHELKSEDTNSRIAFNIFEATCGKAINHLSIQEAAFVPKIKQHWKAIWPTLSLGGSVSMMSSIIETTGWFYETYQKAKQNENNFYVFNVEFTEHPDYNNPEWIKLTKQNLGEKTWRQEILCEFLDKSEENKPEETIMDHINKKIEQDSKGFWFVDSLNEESKLLHECQKRAFERGIRGWSQFGNISDNTEPVKLTFERKKNLEESACGISFDQHVQRPHNFTGFFWPDVAEEIAEEHIFVNEDYSLAKAIEWKKENLRKLEERVNADQYSDDLLVLAGVIESDERTPCNDLDFDGPAVSQEILKRVKELGSFPESLIISFSNKKFCVNEVPTNINEFDLCCLHHGLSVFSSYESATHRIAKLICNRMMPLFGLVKKEKEATDE